MSSPIDSKTEYVLVTKDVTPGDKEYRKSILTETREHEFNKIKSNNPNNYSLSFLREMIKRK